MGESYVCCGTCAHAKVDEQAMELKYQEPVICWFPRSRMLLPESLSITRNTVKASEPRVCACWDQRTEPLVFPEVEPYDDETATLIKMGR